MEDKLLNLLDKKNRTAISMLRKIAEEDTEYSLIFLSEYFDISPRTALRYVNDLQDYIQLYNREIREDFDMIHQKKGVRLIIHHRANINFLISFIFQKDETIQLLEALFVKKYHSMKEYCQETITNTSSAKHMIESINQCLQAYNLQVHCSDFTIEGSEVSIRLVMHNILWLIHRCDESPQVFHVLDDYVIHRNIDFLAESTGISTVNRVKMKDLRFRLSVSLIRYQKKCTVTLSEQQKSYIPIYQNQFGKLTLFEIVEQILNGHHIYDVEEVYFLIYSFLANSLLYTAKPTTKRLFYHHMRLKTDVYNATSFFIDAFQRTISRIPDEKLDDVFEFIFKTHLIASIDVKGFNDYNSYIFDEVRQESPELVHQLEKIIDELQETHQIALFNERMYLLNRYMILKYVLNLKLLYKKPITVMLSTDFPDIYEEFLKEYLIDLYKDKYKILFIEHDFYQRCDLTLTSYYFSEERNSVLNISYPLTDREILHLNRTFEALDVAHQK